jgi:predicted short-subunit dehydrogenase-like oxidoreductase (DUF2520 family)
MNDLSENLRALRVGFIGAGRLGSALAWGLAERGLSVVAVASLVATDAKRLADRIDGCEVLSMQEVVNSTNLVFVTTPDEAIASTAAQVNWRPETSAVHCSGVTEVSALASAASAGAAIGGFHPMQTFGDPMAAMRSLPGCTITIEADEPLLGTLISIAGCLECSVNRLPPGMRGRYHAAAGYTSQFINALFAEALAVLGRHGARGGMRTAATGKGHIIVNRGRRHCQRHARPGVTRRPWQYRKACRCTVEHAAGGDGILSGGV